jgi:hypothetical protein
MTNIIRPLEELPKGHRWSQYLKEKSVGFIDIRLFGYPYYIPINRKFKKIIESNPNIDFEEILSHLVNSMYLQVRDTVGVEIQQELGEQISDGFKRMFDRSIRRKIKDGFDKRAVLIKAKNE